jgi:chromate transporter
MVLGYSTGLKLTLMTATPMYNSFKEIIFLLNLLLKNDGQAELKYSDIFADKDGTFRENGEQILGLVASRYISFMRGENPQSFPIRLFENFYRNGSIVFGGGQVLAPVLYTEFVEFKGMKCGVPIPN